MAAGSEPVYLTEDIRRIEAAAGDAHPPLMERAGRAAADWAVQLAGDRGKDILVLGGPPHRYPLGARH